jgi:hypothetical protein
MPAHPSCEKHPSSSLERDGDEENLYSRCPVGTGGEEASDATRVFANLDRADHRQGDRSRTGFADTDRRPTTRPGAVAQSEGEPRTVLLLERRETDHPATGLLRLAKGPERSSEIDGSLLEDLRADL